MIKLFYLLFFICIISGCASTHNSAKHVFILSGQSNMVGLDVDTFFTPRIIEAFGADNTIVVKDAKGGQPIRRWDKNWQPSLNNVSKNYQAKNNGDLYQRLIAKVELAIKDEQIASLTFLWMQGERDAREQHGHLYQQSFLNIVEQLKRDQGQEKMNVVIGRLSDFDLANNKYKHWTLVRDAQVQLTKQLDNAAWVNTDDLNDGLNRQGKVINNDLHYSQQGYQLFGKRLADAAIALLNE
ncbi:sialate O-acetylesterase [Thalassotalea fonticola]|uniref:Sialate O-acetylesterase n=1 Tax=Thalassotalea fonticola TaxID=3065649 RepID=A0ABZ0GKH9_9GAMM|nr:sialate O-acetylesterase [Colwelliaceae bacterium S1-1]